MFGFLFPSLDNSYPRL